MPAGKSVKTAIIALTPNGLKLARLISRRVGDCEILLPATFKHELGQPTYMPLKELAAKTFSEYRALIMIMSLGIVYRLLAPHIRDKHSDPAVIAVDEGGQYAISALSGHEGGANSLAIVVASAIGAEPVITTASESRRTLSIGLGCRRGAEGRMVVDAVESALTKINRGLEEVKWLATIERKRDEAGLLEAAADLDLPIRFFSAGKINSYRGKYNFSKAADRTLGVKAVCEPCAVLASGNGKLIMEKQVFAGITVAIAERKVDYESAS